MLALRTLPGSLLATGLGLFGTGTAGAEANPYFLGVNQAFSYESNVYNLEDGQPQPPNVQSWTDAISITSLNGGIDQPFGRQRFFFTGNVAQNIYKRNTQLNNLSYGLDTGLDWQTVERLSGTLRLTANQGLGGFNLYGTPESFEKNIQDTQQALATVRWGITPRVALEGGYIFRRVQMSNPAAQNNEYDQNTASVGVSYGGDGVLTFGLAGRFSKTDYPFYELITPRPPPSPAPPPYYLADEADGKNLDLTASWVPSGLSKLEARLSFTDVTHTVNTANDFRGLTGSIRWVYQPSGKFFTRLSVLVAPGTGATFNDFSGSTTPFVNNARSSTEVRLGATYLATGKTRFNGFLALENDRLSQQVSANTIQTGTVSNITAFLGTNYSPTRSIDLSCSLRYDNRSTESTLSHPYSGTTVLCSAELLLK